MKNILSLVVMKVYACSKINLLNKIVLSKNSFYGDV